MSRMPLDFPSEKQIGLYRFIMEYIRRHGYQPSREEMADVFGLGSPTAIKGQLLGLESFGLLRLSKRGRDRAIILPWARWADLTVELPDKNKKAPDLEPDETRLIRYLVDFVIERHRQPTMQEISNETGFEEEALSGLMRALIRKQRISMQDGKWRFAKAKLMVAPTI